MCERSNPFHVVYHAVIDYAYVSTETRGKIFSPNQKPHLIRDENQAKRHQEDHIRMVTTPTLSNSIPYKLSGPVRSTPATTSAKIQIVTLSGGNPMLEPSPSTGQRPNCPRCQGERTNRDGSTKSTQRFKCTTCEKRWSVPRSELAITPATPTPQPGVDLPQHPNRSGRVQTRSNPEPVNPNLTESVQINPIADRTNLESVPTESVPTESVPTESVPTEPGPTELIPARLNPSEPNPREPNPSEPNTHESMPVWTAATERSTPETTAQIFAERTTLEQIEQHFFHLQRAHQLATSIGSDALTTFLQALDIGVQPITATVHATIARALGLVLTQPTDQPPEIPKFTQRDLEEIRLLEAQIRGLQAENREKGSALNVTTTELKTAKSKLVEADRKLSEIHLSRHQVHRQFKDAETRLNIFTREREGHLEALDLAKQLHAKILNELEAARAQIALLTGDRDDFRRQAQSAIQKSERLKAELADLRRNQQATKKSVPTGLPMTISSASRATPNIQPNTQASTPSSTPDFSASAAPGRIAPPLLSPGEQQEIAHRSDALMATLARLEQHQIRRADIAAVTGISGGWKAAIDHLGSLKKIVIRSEFICLTDSERSKRGLA
jgi:hypothetical protein